MEIWKPIEGFEGHYEISDHGTVRSLTRKVILRKLGAMATRWQEGKILKLKKDRYGYLAVHLRNGPVNIYPSVHRLVAKAFLESVEGKNSVNHIDGDKTNNHVSNLEWNSVAENNSHRIKVLGVNFAQGERLPQTILTADSVVKIKTIFRDHPSITLQEIADQFGTSASNISAIKCGRSWTHVVLT